MANPESAAAEEQDTRQHRRVRKKKRTEVGPSAIDSDAPSPRASLNAMPVEILAEILSYVPSPKDVLAVARCNKHLCATLINPDNVSIWRRAREQCHVGPMPPPLSGWSEPAHAAFVFDPGKCEICGNVTKNMYHSFALRIRICGKSQCRARLNSEVLMPDPPKSLAKAFIMQWLPRFEPIRYQAGIAFYPSTSIYRKTDYLQAVDEYNRVVRLKLSMEEYKASHEKEIRRLEPTQTHARALFPWKQLWDLRAREIKKKNLAAASSLALSEGWAVQDLLDSPTYAALHRAHCLCLEEVPLLTFELARPAIEAEILHISEERKRREAEHAHQVRRDDIARHHSRLRSSDTPTVVPTLPIFRALPVLKILQDKDTDKSGVNDELKTSSTIDVLVKGDLDKWTAAARNDLGGVLGYPRWKSASSKVLHPVDRVTARFICQRCNRVPQKYANAGSFDFVGACAHECAGLTRSARRKHAWSAAQFVPDQKAIDVISRAVVLAGSKAEDQAAQETLDSLGARFVCKSCDRALAMDFRRLVGHCKRHDNMQFALVSETESESLMLDHPFEAGFYVELMDRTPEAKKLQKPKTFVCRHCIDVPVPGQAGRASRPKTMIFNGLVSHVKEKHKILQMGDEDFFREASVPPKAAQTTAV